MTRNRFGTLMTCAVGIAFWILAAGSVGAGEMRIKLSDGNTLRNIAYCWEENGLIKFEIPGGTVGIPKSQVAAIEEVIASRPFHPDSMSQREEIYLKLDEESQQWLKDIMNEPISLNDGFVAMDADQVELHRQQRAEAQATQRPNPIQVFSSTLTRTGEISEWVRLPNGDVMLLLNHTVSSYEDLTKKAIVLNLFDGDGQRIRRVPCRIHPLKADRKKMQELGIPGRLYALVASLVPDPDVKRYEIATTRY